MQFHKTEKEILLEQLITKVVKEKFYDPFVKDILIKEFTPAVHENALRHLIDSLNQKKHISQEYLVEHFGILPNETPKAQHEIVEQLKSIFHTQELNKYIADYQEAISRKDELALSELTRKITRLNIKAQKSKPIETDDSDAMMSILDEITDTSAFIKTGLEGFDALKMERGMLVGVLGSTGDGKSIILQKINAMMLKQGYKCNHFTIELTSKLFLKRLIPAFGDWCTYDRLETLSYRLKKELVEKFSMFKPMRIVTVQGGRVSVATIEKNIQETKPDVVFIDYCQLLNEDFNAQKGCDVASRLHQLAVMYNCLIVMALQTNNEGRITDEPPQLEHIKRVKELADDCDIVLSLKGSKLATKSEMQFKIVTRKHRNGLDTEMIYHANLNNGKWILKRLSVNGETILENNYINPFVTDNESPEKEIEEELEAVF
jgi:archaellum biogenesis ATPase FlaH